MEVRRPDTSRGLGRAPARDEAPDGSSAAGTAGLGDRGITEPLTTSQKDEIDTVTKVVEDAAGIVDGLVEKDLAGLNQMMNKADVPFIKIK
jgi:hypothetical protein